MYVFFSNWRVVFVVVHLPNSLLFFIRLVGAKMRNSIKCKIYSWSVRHSIEKWACFSLRFTDSFHFELKPASDRKRRLKSNKYKFLRIFIDKNIFTHFEHRLQVCVYIYMLPPILRRYSSTTFNTFSNTSSHSRCVCVSILFLYAVKPKEK